MKKILLPIFLFYLVLAVIGFVKQGRYFDSIEISGSTTVLPIIQAASEEFMKVKEGVRVDVQGGGSSVGIEAVSNGVADIGMSSRDLKPEEEKGLYKIPLAVDAIAIIVNKKNPVDGLTLEEARKIFSGEIANWKEVGGKDEEIIVVNRDEASGTREAFSKLLMGKKKFLKKAIIQPGSGQVRSVVSSTPGAVGYLSLGYVGDEVKVLSLEGVEPNLENIKQGRYQLARTLYLLTRGKPEGLNKSFIDFVLSPKVQKEIVKKAYVPIIEVGKLSQ